MHFGIWHVATGRFALDSQFLFAVLFMSCLRVHTFHGVVEVIVDMCSNSSCMLQV
jgi:hypothetical protein